MKYNIWFQDAQVLMIIEAKDNQEARKQFNKQIQVKEGVNDDS